MRSIKYAIYTAITLHFLRKVLQKANPSEAMRIPKGLRLDVDSLDHSGRYVFVIAGHALMASSEPSVLKTIAIDIAKRCNSERMTNSISIREDEGHLLSSPEELMERHLITQAECAEIISAMHPRGRYVTLE